MKITDYKITYSNHDLKPEVLINLYKALLKPRLIEEKMLILLRQGKISKWFSGIGQEAIAVGVTAALDMQDFILPMHRNLGVFTTRDIPLYRLFAQWQGKASGFTKGRDRSFHFGSIKYNIVGMISHLGPQMGVANGIALANLLKGNKGVTAVFSGEGGTSEGDFHEALNIASVWQLPVIFCIENNGYGLSTPTNEQYNCKHLADRGIGYGMEAHIIDGNNIIEVYTKLQAIVSDLRINPRPVLIEFNTFRMRGHEEASGTAYVPDNLLNEWQQKDPVENFKAYLLSNNYITEADHTAFAATIREEIDSHLNIAYAEPDIEPNIKTELADVFAPDMQNAVNTDTKTVEMRFIDAISDGLSQAMERHDNLIIMGQDIAEYGGVFKITEGFVERFGKDRVRNTPICESGVVEVGMGLAIAGYKSVVEMQFADFVSSGFNPIVNYLAKTYYRWQQTADVVIRMPCGAGVGAGPFHSQTNEAWFTKTPGLKVIYPAFPYDAKGLLNTAINDPNPVLFFEHKMLYRSVKQDVPTGYYSIPLGKASILQSGEAVSIITYGAGVHWALEILKEFDTPVDADLIDLRCLNPLDTETIFNSVKKTGKAIILQEDSEFGGMASDISALIMEHCFEYLDAAVQRVTSLNTPIPFFKPLETQYLAKSRFKEALITLMSY